MGQLMSSILVMFGIIVLSFIIKQLRLMPENTTSVLTALLFNVTLPALIFSSMANGSGKEILGQGLVLMGVSFASYLVASLIAIFFLRRNSQPNVTIRVLAFSALFANTAFIGLPLIYLIFGETGVVLGALFDQVQTLFMFTAGIALLGGKGEGWWQTIRNRFQEPPVAALVVGFLVIISGIKIPAVILEPIKMLGNTTSAIAMFAIGQYMDLNCFKDGKRLIKLVPVLGIKLLLIPLGILGVTSFLPMMTVEMRGVAAIMLACPTAVMAAVMAERYEQDYEFAVMAVVATTGLSIITLPLIVSLLQS